MGNAHEIDDVQEVTRHACYDSTRIKGSLWRT